MKDSSANQNSGKGDSFFLIRTCITIALGGFLFGFDTAVISGVIVFLKNKFVLDAFMEGWLVSSALIGCLIGVSFSGKLSDKFGPRKILFLSALFFLFSAIITALSDSYMAIICGRIIGGLGIGAASMLSPLFISEFSPKYLRGRMVSLYQFAITIGIVAAYFSNSFLLNFSLSENHLVNEFARRLLVDEVWRGMFGTLIIPAALFILLLIFISESPRWLAKKGKDKHALEILSRVNGRTNAEEEISVIKESIKSENESLRQLLKPGLRKALLIGLILPFASQACGINAIIYYGPKIFKDAGYALNDAFGTQVTIGLMNVFFTTLAIWKVDKFGRKPLLLSGMVGVFVSLVFIAIAFNFSISNGILLLSFFLLFIACFAFSYGPVVWIIIAEIFPNRIRGRAMSISTFSLWFANIIIGQSFPWLLENLGPAGTFALFALITLPATIFVWKVIPETKGKTLEEIEIFFSKSAI
ncbi:MAG: sugar porter family MFS transporter [Bacteroidota bacterium]|nr:sugar porter family MFS transporter [Bacteroidota bacterium]MDP4195138.1 sugar porter family MFS transporter [Bacteroidota bacterium]